MSCGGNHDSKALEQQLITARERECDGASRARKLDAVLSVLRGADAAKVRRALSVGVRTIHKWVKRAEQTGV